MRILTGGLDNMRIELKCFYTSKFTINQPVMVALNRFKPEEETEFFVHEIKAESIIIEDKPKEFKMKKLFILALNRSSR